MPRRVSPEIIPGDPKNTSYTYGNPIVSQNLDGFLNFKSRTTFSGSTTPGWNTLSNRQKKVAKPLDYTYTREVHSAGSYNEFERRHRESEPWSWTGSWLRGTDYFGAFSWPSPAHIGEAEDKALSNLVSKASGVKTNLAESFAERRQLLNLVRDTATRIVTAAYALKHGRLGDFNEALSTSYGSKSRRWEKAMRTIPEKRLSQHWLEFKYGWLPLISDVHGASQLLSEHIRSKTEVIHISGSSRKELESATSVEAPLGVWTRAVSKTVSTTKFAVSFTVDSESRQILSQTGISNPALLAWELLPYSFVVDWFIPVGQYLENLNGFSGLVFDSGYKSRFTTLQYNEEKHGVSDYGWQGSWFSEWSFDASFARKVILFNRQALSGFPVANPPSFKMNPIGGEPINRAITALSLLATAFGRKPVL